MKKERKNFNIDLSIACSDDELRPVMSYVYFKDGYAYATDAHILIKQSLEYHNVENKEALNGKSIHRKAFSAIYKYPFAKATESGIECIDEFGNKVIFMYANFELKYPNREAVIGQFESDKYSSFALNVNYVAKANKLLFRGDNKHLTIELGKNLMHKIYTTDCDYKDQFILIMGVHDGDDF